MSPRSASRASCLRIAVLAFAASMVGFGSARAESRYYNSSSYRPLTADCVISAAKLQGVPFPIIFGFLKTEGGHTGQESSNGDGSFDLGTMQVNDSAWLHRIARMHFNGDIVAARNSVRDDGCYNVHIGTWIFKQALVEAGGDYRRAVGYYNSHTPMYADRYVRRYAQNLEQVLTILNRVGK